MIVHPIGRASQGQLAQRDQITFAKEVLDGSFRLTSDIDLAFVQALAQIIGEDRPAPHRQRHRKRIGNGFAHLNTSDAADHIIETFQMLDVNGGKDVDTGFQQLFNILPALWMA